MKIEINSRMIERSFKFAESIISKRDQFNRVPADNKKRIQRTCVGKLAECCFLLFIRDNFEVNYPEGDMFRIFSGQTNVDQFDFKTKSGQTIDIKTAFLPNHHNIMIPLDQLEKIPKDIYVGIKLNGSYEDSSDLQLVDLDSITEAEIVGQLKYEDVLRQPIGDWGSPCKVVALTSLEKFNLKF